MILNHAFRCKKAKNQVVEVLVPRWAAPAEGSVCVNVDAALFPAEQRMGWGAVVRDHNGAFLLSCIEGLAGLPVPEIAEVVAVRAALLMSRDHGFRKIILVSDCLSLINQISCSIKDRSDLGTVVGDIKSLKTDFEFCCIRFSSRRSNIVAHKLARSSEPLLCNLSIGVILKLIRVELCNDVM
jgi:ribonuclease HI